jgi:hypothetical protein
MDQVWSVPPDHEAFCRKTQHLVELVAELIVEAVEAAEAAEAVEPKTCTRLVGARQKVNSQLKFQPFASP